MSSRETSSADQVRKLYEVVGSLWPPGTDASEYLPEPDGTLRALYLGDINPRNVIRNVARFGLYVDEILIVDPFRSPWTFSDEYNPLIHPEVWIARGVLTVHDVQQPILGNARLPRPFISGDAGVPTPDREGARVPFTLNVPRTAGSVSRSPSLFPRPPRKREPL